MLVMRLWPRGVRRDRIGLWLKDAAPSRALLDTYAHAGLALQDFAQRYRLEMLQQRPHALEQLRRLEAEHGTLTLLCHERIPPREYCHRLTLTELLAGRGG